MKRSPSAAVATSSQPSSPSFSKSRGSLVALCSHCWTDLGFGSCPVPTCQALPEMNAKPTTTGHTKFRLFIARSPPHCVWWIRRVRTRLNSIAPPNRGAIEKRHENSTAHTGWNFYFMSGMAMRTLLACIVLLFFARTVLVAHDNRADRRLVGAY